MKWQDIKTYIDVYMLSETELRDYIKARLQFIQEGLFPPIVTSRDEEPEDFIINAFKSTVHADLLEEFYNAVTFLVNEQWDIAKASSDRIDGKYLSHLLYFVEYFRIRKSHDPIYFFAANHNYLINIHGYYTDKVYEQVLRALAALQDGPPGYIELWKKILKDPQLQEYAQAAFTGLRFCGLDCALEAIPDYAKIASERENYIIKLGNSLVSLIRQYGTEDNVELIIQKIVDSVIDKKWSGERKAVLEALRLSPKIDQEYKYLIIPLLPWGFLKALPEAIDRRKPMKSPPPYKLLDYAIPGIGDIINNLIITLRNNFVKESEATVESINQFMNILDNISIQRIFAVRSKPLPLLDKLSHILSNQEIIIEIKRKGDKKLSRRLLQTKERCLSLLEIIKGENTTRVNRITNIISKAVLADMIGSVQDVIQWIKEVKRESPESVIGEEWEKELTWYMWYSTLGDFYRLLSKTEISENISDDLAEAKKFYEKALEKSTNAGRPLLWSRLSETLLLKSWFFFDKNQYDDVIVSADQAIKVCEEWLRYQKDGKKYSINLRISDVYSLKNSAYEALGQIENANKYFDLGKNSYNDAITENPHHFAAYYRLFNLYLTKNSIMEAVNVLDRFRDNTSIKRSNEWIEYKTAELLADYGFAEHAVNRLTDLLINTQPRNTKAANLLSSLINDSEVLDIDIARKFVTKFIGTIDLTNLTNAQSVVVFSIKSWLPEWERIEQILQEYSGAYAQEKLAQYYFELARGQALVSEKQQQYLTKAKNYNEKLEKLSEYDNDKIVWTRRARIELLQGNIEEAQNLLNELEKKFPEDEYIPFHLGECCQRQGDYSKALEYYQKAYNKIPLIDSADRIAFCQFRLGKPEDSLKIFEHIVETNPMDATAFHAMGMVYFELGNNSKAAEQWIKALQAKTKSFLEEDIPIERRLQEAKWTAKALVSLLNGDNQLNEKILSVLHDENPRLAALLIDQLSVLSFFESDVANKILQIIDLNRPLRLKRRVAQYCMGRAIFLSLGLISDENPNEWINRVIESLSKVSNDLIAEFLAGAKGSYERAIRKFATLKQSQSSSGLAQILSATDPPPAKWDEFYEHISTSVGNPDYYKKAETLVSRFNENEISDYAIYQIKELSKKIVQDIGLSQQLSELRKYLLKEENQLSDKDIIDKLEKELKLLSAFRSIKELWQIDSFQKEMENGNGKFQVDINGNEWKQLGRHAIWFDGKSIAHLGRWYFKVITSNGNANSKRTKVPVSWKIENDGSVSCTFKTDKHIDRWPPEIDKLLVDNSVAKLERSDGIGFVRLPDLTFS